MTPGLGPLFADKVQAAEEGSVVPWRSSVSQYMSPALLQWVTAPRLCVLNTWQSKETSPFQVLQHSNYCSWTTITTITAHWNPSHEFEIHIQAFSRLEGTLTTRTLHRSRLQRHRTASSCLNLQQLCKMRHCWEAGEGLHATFLTLTCVESHWNKWTWF